MHQTSKQVTLLPLSYLEMAPSEIGLEDFAVLDAYIAQRGKKQQQLQPHLPPPPPQQQKQYYYEDRYQYQPPKPHVYHVIVPVPATVKKEAVSVVDCYQEGGTSDHMKTWFKDFAAMDEYVAQRGKKQQPHLPPPQQQQKYYYENRNQYHPPNPHVYQVTVPVPATVKKEAVSVVDCYEVAKFHGGTVTLEYPKMRMA